MNWSELGKKVADFAPLLGSVLGPAGAGVGALISSEFGTENTPDAIGALLTGNPEAQVKLKEIELTHKAQLQEIKLQTLQAELGDKANARNSHKNSIMPAVITVLMSVLAVCYVACLFFVDIPVSNKDMVNYFGGQLIAMWFASVVYWTGTTRGSEDKTRLLGK